MTWRRKIDPGKMLTRSTQRQQTCSSHAQTTCSHLTTSINLEPDFCRDILELPLHTPGPAKFVQSLSSGNHSWRPMGICMRALWSPWQIRLRAMVV